ncbi:hypothetical protein COU77_01060 [Candidatus Peregrinibacteria bacterium CG10_big_fil_rev_8_21_14_0_10_49_16]|nr:MAG: hypothetical protein COW95_04200 [Candidatus Peregrinibacteria bacterium CG22_combo_CG10-13_8_21_14_all_49_11]PIR52300.1 MAG: hypothetical protein COU77_01060 [Candidatus Peregrinibacteria bacterium CG10_big_fil_rev_8_21_14_0_10_49_16]
MSLQDIRNAIVSQADEEIAVLLRDHQHNLRQLTQESEHAIADLKRNLRSEHEQKIQQLRTHASMRFSIEKRNMLLQKKQELLSRLYAQVIDRLCGLPTPDLRAFLSHCLAQCPHDGTVCAAKEHIPLLKELLKAQKGVTVGDPIDARGGFIFLSGQQERDFTFGHLVDAYLRPLTEVEVSKELFATHT